MKLTKTTLALSLCMLLLHAKARDLLDDDSNQTQTDFAITDQDIEASKAKDCPKMGEVCNDNNLCCGGLWCAPSESIADVEQEDRTCTNSGPNGPGGGNDCVWRTLVDACECDEQNIPMQKTFTQIVAESDGNGPQAVTCQSLIDLGVLTIGQGEQLCEDPEFEGCPSPACEPDPVCTDETTEAELDALCAKNDQSAVSDWWCNPGGQCAACPVGLTERQLERATTEAEKVALVKDHKGKNCCVPQRLKIKHCDYCKDAECVEA